MKFAKILKFFLFTISTLSLIFASFLWFETKEDSRTVYCDESVVGNEICMESKNNAFVVPLINSTSVVYVNKGSVTIQNQVISASESEQDITSSMKIIREGGHY